MKLTRFEKNPVIAPTKNWWETRATFNPGATIFENKILLLYRAIGGDGLSRFGLALSSDGKEFERFDKPFIEAETNNPYERLGVEDPRISKIEDTFYIVYTAPSVYPADDFPNHKFVPSLSHSAPWRVRPSLIATKDFKTFERKGVILNKDTKDSLLLPEKISDYFVLFHRVYPNVYITYSKDLKNWEDEKILFTPRENFWDSERVGMGSVPFKTEEGWLSFYHAVDLFHNYQVGVLLLDKKDPSKVIFRSEEPVLKPETDYEKNGEVDNVVFTCAALEKGEEIFVYYGAADKVIGLATIKKGEIKF